MLSFALRHMATRRARLAMTALSVVLTAAVALLAYNISTQVSEGIVNTAARYDIIIGPSGSATQLAMNTMFFTDKPLGTIPYSLVDELKGSGLVNEAIPFSMGDSYNAAPVVGTDARLLDGRALAAGAMFNAPMEAVVGWDVAHAYGLAVGDRMVTSHGLGGDGSEHADHPLTVTGILARTDTAYDGAVFTPVGSIWALHDHEDDDAHGAESDAASGDGAEAAAPDSDDTHDSHASHGSDDDGGPRSHASSTSADAADGAGEADGEICAVLVRSTGFNAYTQLMNRYGDSARYLAINPNTVLREVLDNVDLSRRIVYILCAVILAMNLLVVTLLAVLNTHDARDEIALMRLIGIGMRRINRLYLLENALAGLAATALSLLAAHAALSGIRGFVSRMGIVLNAARVYPMEWLILLGVFLLSILPTTLMTRRMARRDVLRP